MKGSGNLKIVLPSLPEIVEMYQLLQEEILAKTMPTITKRLIVK